MVRWVGLLLISTVVMTARAAEVDDLIAKVQAVGPKGKGNQEASKAISELTQGGINNMLPVLKGIDSENALAANWLRGAFEEIVDAELSKTKTLPKTELEDFVKETSHDPRARRLAYDWLLKVDPTATERLIPGMLNDPSVEFRRDAVERLAKSAQKEFEGGNKDKAKELYIQALEGARDEDQVTEIVKVLDKQGHKVDVPRHFGIIQNWHVIGPFDNAGGKGFEAVYPPEQTVDLKAKYEGKGEEALWKPLVTRNPQGIFDLAKLTQPYKGSASYAYTEYESTSEGSVQVRLGTPNAWKLWVNGEFVFGREEYHRGMVLDQYTVPVKLKKGKNTILLKVCQNEQGEPWAQRWQFQVRVCDRTGTALLATNRPEAPEYEEASENPE